MLQRHRGAAIVRYGDVLSNQPFELRIVRKNRKTLPDMPVQFYRPRKIRRPYLDRFCVTAIPHAQDIGAGVFSVAVDAHQFEIGGGFSFVVDVVNGCVLHWKKEGAFLPLLLLP